MIKGFPGNIQEMLQQAQKLQQDITSAQQEVEQKEVSASSGGGMVTVRVNGKQEVVELRIDPSVIDSSDVEMLQDLISAAVNEGLRNSKNLLKEEMSKITGGLNLPIPGFGG